MFSVWVSRLAVFIATIYEYVINLFRTNYSVRFVTINMGGRTKNPFEYLFETIHKDSFYNYKKTFRTVKKTDIIDEFINIGVCCTPEMNLFITFLKNNSIPDEIFDYFFTDNNDSKIKLKLDSKYGRQADGSDGVRFNPIEHGYDKIPNSNYDSMNQYEFTRQYAISKLGLSDLIQICMSAAEDNNMDFNRTDVCNLVLFDIMNIIAVYNHYTDFDKIYLPKNKDTRIRQVTDSYTPCIIATQETKINDSRFRIIAHSPRGEKGGTHIYSYRLNTDDLKVITTEETNYYLGNDKGVCVYLKIFGKPIKVVSLHTKDPSKIEKVSSLDEFVENGISDLLADIPTVIMGDFNPENNVVSNDIKTMMKEKTGCSVFPGNNVNTTKKVRSGYCAQMSKMFKTNNSEVSKDMIFHRGLEQYYNRTKCCVYPEMNLLMSDTWYGDHSAVWVTFDFKDNR